MILTRPVVASVPRSLTNLRRSASLFQVPRTAFVFQRVVGVFMSLKMPAVVLFEVSFCWVFVSPQSDRTSRSSWNERLIASILRFHDGH